MRFVSLIFIGNDAELVRARFLEDLWGLVVVMISCKYESLWHSVGAVDW